MPIQHQSQLYQFSLVFLSVKMKVKFPCKLSLEHMGNIITSEVSAREQNKFLINEEVVVKDESEKKFVEIVVNLITEKGSKYIAGIVKLFHNELLRSEGQRIVVALGKCLDSEAFCEVRVEKVVVQKVPIRNGVFRGSKVGRETQNKEHIFSPIQNNTNFKSATNLGHGFGTRSQAQFSINNPLKPNREWQQKRETCALTYYQKNKASPPKTRRKLGDISKVKFASNTKLTQDEQNTNRQKLIEAQVYKQNYVRLKQKYRKESQNYKQELNKRIALQNNQNNYKLQIVRLRLKCEQLQKSYNDKTLKLRDLQGQLSILQQKDIDINYYRQETVSLKNNISMLQDTIITLNNQNQKLKELNKEREHQYETKINQVQSQYEKVKSMYEAKQAEYDRDMRVMKDELIQLEYQLNSKTQSLQKEKNYIFQFEKTSQAKLFQFDTLLQNQRNNSRAKYEDLKIKFQKLQLENKQLLQEKKDLEAEKQTHRSYVMKAEYQYKLHLQQINTVKNQLQQLYSLRDKHQKLIIQFKTLRDEKQFSTKNFDKLLKSKQLSLQEIVAENKKEIEFIKKINSDLGDKNKGLIEKNIQYEGMIESLKNTVEKTRRNLESLTREFTQLKEKEKSLKKLLSQKQQQVDELKQKIQKASSKQTNLIQTKRAQLEKMSQIISKLKIDLETESGKNSKLLETNAQLSHQISRMKMLLQFAQDKLQKNNISAQQKYKSYEGIVQEHQSVIAMLEENINDIKVKENQLFSKFSHLQNQYNLIKEQHDKLIKENKILNQKLSSLQLINKQKSSEYSSLLTKYEGSQKRNQALQSQIHQAKTELSLIKGERDKTLKLLQISSGQNEKCRETIIRFSGDIFDRENKIDAKTKQLNRLQQELEKANYKNQSLSREYMKFRDTFAQLMGSSQKEFQAIKHETMSIVGNIATLPTANDQRVSNGYQSLNGYGLSSVQGNSQWQNPHTFSSNNNIFSPHTLFSPQQRKQKLSSCNQLNSKSFSDMSAFASQMMNLFSSYTKQNQSTVSKLIQRSKVLSKELQSTRSQLSQQISINQELQYEFQRQKQQIQEQLRTITQQKGSQSIKLHSLLQQVKQQLYQKQQLLQQAHSQLDQLQFTLSSNKMDYQTSINQLDKKNYQLKQFIDQIQQKNQFQHNVITSLEQKCYELDKEIIQFRNSLIDQKELSYKRESQVLEGLKEIRQFQQLLEREKQKYNQLLETVSNLQVQLATEKQTRLKLQNCLAQQQEKKKQLKAFSANIIRQKQTIIKQELQHHQKLSDLQNKLIQAEHHKQLLLDEIQTLKQEINQLRQDNKKLAESIKQTEKELSLEKLKLSQSQKIIKQKEKQIHEIQNSTKQHKKKSQLKQNQYKKTINQLNEQISFMAKHKQKLTQQMSQKLSIQQTQLKGYQQLINDQKSQLQQLQQHLYSYKQKYRLLQQNLTSRQHEVNQLKYRTEHLQSLQTDLEQDSKDKEENMYQLSATIYELQNKISLIIKEKQTQVQQVNNEWNLKYQELYQELQQRFQLLEKEKLYLKEQIIQKDNQINKKNQEKHIYQTDTIASNKLLQDKIKKLQQERLTLLTTKNSQLQKQSQQLKELFQSTKKKQAQNRKLSHQLQIARNQIIKLDSRIIQLDNKIKSMNKLYQQELQQMKKKELIYKGFREEVINQQWNTQREVRKLLQGFVKGLLACDDQMRDNKAELMQLLKNLQTGVIAAIKLFDQRI